MCFSIKIFIHFYILIYKNIGKESRDSTAKVFASILVLVSRGHSVSQTTKTNSTVHYACALKKTMPTTYIITLTIVAYVSCAYLFFSFTLFTLIHISF